MPHIHTEPGQYDHTVSFFIIRTDFVEPKIILHKHRKSQLLSMFGGHVELNESPWETLVRELQEETGYDKNQVEILQPQKRIKKATDLITHPQPLFVHTGKFPCEPEHFHSDMMYALVTNQRPKNHPRKGESTDIRLYTLRELHEIPNEDIYEPWREIGRYIVEEILDSYEKVNMNVYK